MKKAEFEFGSITTQSQAFIEIDFTVKINLPLYPDDNLQYRPSLYPTPPPMLSTRALPRAVTAVTRIRVILKWPLELQTAAKSGW